MAIPMHAVLALQLIIRIEQEASAGVIRAAVTEFSSVEQNTMACEAQKEWGFSASPSPQQLHPAGIGRESQPVM